jgi:hypothetical protein
MLYKLLLYSFREKDTQLTFQQDPDHLPIFIGRRFTRGERLGADTKPELRQHDYHEVNNHGKRRLSQTLSSRRPIEVKTVAGKSDAETSALDGGKNSVRPREQ